MPGTPSVAFPAYSLRGFAPLAAREDTAGTEGEQGQARGLRGGGEDSVVGGADIGKSARDGTGGGIDGQTWGGVSRGWVEHGQEGDGLVRGGLVEGFEFKECIGVDLPPRNVGIGESKWEQGEACLEADSLVGYDVKAGGGVTQQHGKDPCMARGKEIVSPIYPGPCDGNLSGRDGKETRGTKRVSRGYRHGQMITCQGIDLIIDEADLRGCGLSMRGGGGGCGAGHPSPAVMAFRQGLSLLVLF
jgi:hypothetical protein